MNAIRLTLMACITAVVTTIGLGSASANAADMGHGRDISRLTAKGSSASKPETVLEPHSWNLWCRDVYGQVYYVNNPADCTRGNVKFISTYSGQVDATMDVNALYYKIDRSYTLNMAYRDCQGYVICGIALGAAEAFVLSKLKAAWTAIRAIKGITSTPAATSEQSMRVAPGTLERGLAHAGT